MDVMRRGVLGAGAVLVAAPAFATAVGAAPVSVRASGVSPGFRAAFDRYVAFAAADLAAWTFPAMTLSLRGPKGETATAAIGHANLDAREPATPDHLFQIGSISKSFVAVALLRLADQGRIDLDRPVLDYAPDMPLSDGRVTVAHILAHTAGLPRNAPPFPRETGGKLWTATDPGSRFSYSNSGYDTLGLLVARASDMDFVAAMKALVFDPLGMKASWPTIRSADRGRFARGYDALRPSVAWFPGDPLAEGPWLDIDRAAGPVASTPGDMATYMGFVGACATGRPQALLSRAGATRFVTSVIDAAALEPGARYGMGLSTFDIDGKPVLHHTGGMITFSSAMTVDKALGAGAFASVNITGSWRYRPRKVTAYGVRLLRAVAAGAPLPAVPEAVALAPVENGADLAGRWVGPGGRELIITDRDGALGVAFGGAKGRMRLTGARSFITDHPAPIAHLLAFEGEKGRAERLWWGDAAFGRDAAPVVDAVPAALTALAGTYRSNDPWVGETSIVARGAALVIEGAGEIVPHADGSWRSKDPGQVTERLWFDAFANGKAQRLSVSGETCMRIA